VVVLTKLDDTINLKENMRKIARMHNMVFAIGGRRNKHQQLEFYLASVRADELLLGIRILLSAFVP
jgi:hypothetical protein